MIPMTQDTSGLNDRIARQFGPRAADYVASAVHAGGEDLHQLAAVAQAVRPNRALDMGCGGGHVAYALAPWAGRVVAFDLLDDMLAEVRAEAQRRSLANLETRQGSVEDLPFEGQGFDLAASRYSAHHWRDLGAGLAEARRVLRVGGTAVFMDVVAPESVLADTALQTVELLRDPSHVRDYSVREWQAALTGAGFRVDSVMPRRLRLDFATWVRRMRTPDTHAAAIRSLQTLVPGAVRRHFEIEDDGSFTIDTATFVCS